jgi:hypothetical protein
LKFQKHRPADMKRSDAPTRRRRKKNGKDFPQCVFILISDPLKTCSKRYLGFSTWKWRRQHTTSSKHGPYEILISKQGTRCYRHMPWRAAHSLSKKSLWGSASIDFYL